MPERPRTLLRPGATEWKALEAEKRAALRPHPDASVESLLRRGAALSRQAGKLRRALLPPRERPAA